jgi:hypothetical protein
MHPSPTLITIRAKILLNYLQSNTKHKCEYWIINTVAAVVPAIYIMLGKLSLIA